MTIYECKSLKPVVEKRTFRNIRSKLKKNIRRGGRPSNELLRKYNLTNFNINKSHYFNAINRNNPAKDWVRIIIPRIFCFISDHDETFRFFDKLIDKLNRKKPVNLHFVHNNVQMIGLAASYVFDRIINGYVVRWENKGVRISMGGETGDKKDVNNFLLSFGLLSDTKFDGKFPEGFVDSDYENKFETFKFHGTSRSAHQKSVGATKLADYFKNCYKYNNLTLSEEVHHNLISAFGEIIGNAEEHSTVGNDVAHWDAMGYYNKDKNYCRFAIINYGKTFYENLSDSKSELSESVSAIKGIIRKQKTYYKKIMNSLFPLSKEEPIWNVMALQDGISSKRTKSGTASTRGQGLMDVLEFVSDLKADEDSAEIAILSGKSKIVVDYQYPIIKRPIGEKKEVRRLIIFNTEQDLKRPQDEKKVISMNNHFSGTIITGRFTINKKYLDHNNVAGGH